MLEMRLLPASYMLLVQKGHGDMGKQLHQLSLGEHTLSLRSAVGGVKSALNLPVDCASVHCS